MLASSLGVTKEEDKMPSENRVFKACDLRYKFCSKVINWLVSVTMRSIMTLLKPINFEIKVFMRAILVVISCRRWPSSLTLTISDSRFCSLNLSELIAVSSLVSCKKVYWLRWPANLFKLSAERFAYCSRFTILVSSVSNSSSVAVPNKNLWASPMNGKRALLFLSVMVELTCLLSLGAEAVMLICVFLIRLFISWTCCFIFLIHRKSEQIVVV